MPACPAFDPAAPYLTEMVATVDCHSLALGADGYQALGPASGFGQTLAGMVAIFIALIGYRLLLGERLGLRDAVLAGLRIGIVIALATSWSAYRPLVYDLVTQTPEALAATLSGDGSDPIATDASAPNPDIAAATLPMVARAQSVIDAIGALIPPAMPTASPPALPSPLDPAAASPTPEVPLPVVTTLARAGQILTLSTLAGVLSVRVVAAILLAVGPVFAAFLLFEATWGLFAGWVRALAGAALGAMAMPLVLAVETAILAPQVAALAARISANQALAMLPEEIVSTAAVFALITLAALAGMVRVAWGFALPAAWRRGGAESPAPAPWAHGPPAPLVAPPPAMPLPATRAQAIAATVERLDSRIGRAGQPGGPPLRGRADAPWRPDGSTTGRAATADIPRRSPTPGETRTARHRDESR